MIARVPVCVVIVPANAAARSDEVSLNAAPVWVRVIAPLVPLLIAFNSSAV